MEVVENNKVKCSFLIDDNNEYLYNNLMSGNIAYTPRFIVYDAVDVDTANFVSDELEQYNIIRFVRLRFYRLQPHELWSPKPSA